MITVENRTRDHSELVCSYSDGTTFRCGHGQKIQFDEKLLTPLLQRYVDNRWLVIVKEDKKKTADKSVNKEE